MKHKFKAVIFDLDGTLLNTINDLSKSGNYTLEKMNLPTHTVEEYKLFVGNGIPRLISRMLPANSTAETKRQALETFMEYYSLHSEDETAPYEGITELLTALKKQGLKLCVLTNKADSVAQTIIRKYFGDCFDIIKGLTDDTKPKPDTENALKMVSILNIRADEILYVGDSGVDMELAQNAGFLSCGVLWGFRRKDELLAKGADFLAEKPMEILTLI